MRNIDTKAIWANIKSIFSHTFEVLRKLTMRTKLIILGTIFAAAVVAVVLAVFLPGSDEAQVASAAAVPTAPAAPTPSLEPVITTAPEPSVDPTLEIGEESAYVREFQERLRDLGYLDTDESTQV